ncbi:MAG: TonB-dependent receptor [Niabella sp.]
MKKCIIANSYCLLRYLFILFLCCPLGVFAQKENVQGIVLDENDQPLAKVSILAKGSSIATVSDKDGQFKLSGLDPKTTLLFSFTGYKTAEVYLDGTQNLVVRMELAVTNLSEVVVIGYGQAARKDLTGAISSIKPQEQDAVQFNSIDGLLKGRLAGVQVTSSSGAPGGVSTVKIRGVNSLRSDNEPLYVVDGIIINTTTNDVGDGFSINGVANSGNAGQERQSGLTGINTIDIESIEVLKDASATAIYGSRGANGVIIITTKQGRAGKAQINFSANTEFSNVVGGYNLLNGKEFAQYTNEVRRLQNLEPRYNPDTVSNVNWQDEMFKTGITHTYRVSAQSGSNDKGSSYYIAGGYLGVDGILKNTGVNQGDLKVNMRQKLSNKFTVNFNLSSIYRTNDMTTGTEPLGATTASLISQILLATPFTNPVNDAGNDVAYADPYSWINDYDDISKEARTQLGLGVQYNISKVFGYRLNLAYDTRQKERSRWYGFSTYQGSLTQGSLGINDLRRNYYLVENLLNFKKSFRNEHRINGTFGITYDQENNKLVSVVNQQFFSDGLRTDGLGYGSTIYQGVPNRSKVELFSVLARINYNYADRYLLTVSGRADGSSKFKGANRMAYFPAAALAWRISQEEFLQDVKSISDIKLRIGFGITGNQGISPYNTFAQYSSSLYPNPSGGVTTGVGPANIQNENLKWESTKQWNAGLDVSLFEERVSFSADAYYKKTSDLLQQFALPYSSGYTTITQNLGDMENKGFELSFNYEAVRKSDFRLSAGGNIGFYRNKILNLGLAPSQLGSMGDIVFYLGNNISTSPYFKEPANIFIEGRPLGLFYGFQTNGVYQEGDDLTNKKFFGTQVVPGDLIFVDQNGDNNITNDDKVILGNPNPKFNYGFTTSLQYKKASLRLFFSGSYGNDVVNGNLIRLYSPDGVGTNVIRETYLNAWTPTNPSDYYPRLNYSQTRLIDRYVENGSYLRLATAILSYQFTVNNSRFLKALTASVTGRNLLLLTNYSGFDPEVNSFSFDPNRIGVDWSSYPNTRGITIGINATF